MQGRREVMSFSFKEMLNGYKGSKKKKKNKGSAGDGGDGGNSTNGAEDQPVNLGAFPQSVHK